MCPFCFVLLLDVPVNSYGHVSVAVSLADALYMTEVIIRAVDRQASGDLI